MTKPSCAAYCDLLHRSRGIRAGLWTLCKGALCAALPLLLCAAAFGADWPQWRGPGRDGKSLETGLMKEWPKEGPPLAWTAAGIGGGFSSVAVVGDRIYTMGDGKDSSFVYALDANGGKKLWEAKVGKTGGGGGYPGPRSTPTVDGERLFAMGQYGDLVCLEAASGKEVWRTNMKSDFGGEMMSGWGYAESPLVDGGHVIVTPGGIKGTMAALDKATGKLAWRSEEWTDKAAYASAITADIGGKKQYVQLTGDSVAGVDAESGKLLWRADRKGQTAVIPTPIVHDNLVYVASGYGVGCNLFKVTPPSDGAGDFKVEQVYANRDMKNHHGGLVFLDGYVYGFSDSQGWTCMDLKTGDVAWKQREDAPGKGSLCYADGRFYLRDEGKGTIALIDASSKEYKSFGSFVQPDRSKAASWPHPAIAGGKLYIRDQDKLYCYDIAAQGAEKAEK